MGTRDGAAEIAGGQEKPDDKARIEPLPQCLACINRIPPQLQELIMDVVYAVCDGMQKDLSFFPHEKAPLPKAFDAPADLERYCRLMGGKPGLFWSRLICRAMSVSLPEEKFFEWGQHIGDALQIVNILRDLPKDLRIGRCYFRRTDLQQAGLTAQDLLNPGNSPRFEHV